VGRGEGKMVLGGKKTQSGRRASAKRTEGGTLCGSRDNKKAKERQKGGGDQDK